MFTTATTTTTNYLYDDDNDIEELNSSGTILARYAQGDNTDEPLAESRSSTTSFYEADGLGSVTSLTNGSGTIGNSYTYDSFGNLTASSGSVVNPFQYTGRDFDSETGLRYYRARYYDAGSGRFLSEDPLDFETGTNFYDYVANDPTTLIDPLGLWHCAAGADCNFTPDFKKGLDCFQKCVGADMEIVITSGRRPPTPTHPNSSHSRGEACDIGRNSNPNLPRDKTVKCFLQCFPNSYGQEEHNGGGTPGTHFHFQQNPLPGTQPGFPPGIRPYSP